MAYGNGQNLLNLTIPTGKTPLDAELLPSGKLSDLKIFSERYLDTANIFVDAVFTPEPLAGTLIPEEIHKILLAEQKEITGLDKAYTEKARLTVPNAINQVEKK